MPTPETVELQISRRTLRRIKIALLLLVAATFATVATVFLLPKSQNSPIRATIRKSVSFPLYYPDPDKLPSGYTLDLSSFKTAPAKEAVVYNVKYGDKKLIFTVQKAPSNDELQTFIKRYIPINRKVETLVGTATLGAIGNQTVISLPTKDTSWILITGPEVIDRSQVAQVLKAIQKDR